MIPDVRNLVVYGLLALLAVVGFLAFKQTLALASLEREVAQERQSWAELTAAQGRAMRTREAKLRTDIDTLKENTDAKIKRLARDNRALSDELRKRPARPDPAVPVPPPSPGADATVTGSTGAGLYSEDALFLAGEAAVADERRELLLECRAAYETLRNAYAAQDP